MASAKICGSTDPDPRGNQPKTAEKNLLLSKPKSELFKKREIIKISLFLNGSSSLSIKMSEKNKKKIENSAF